MSTLAVEGLRYPGATSNAITLQTDGRIAINAAASNLVAATFSGTNNVNIDLDFSLTNSFTVSFTGSKTLANPTNVAAGQSGMLIVTSTGTQTSISYGSYWLFEDGSPFAVTQGTNAKSILFFTAISSTEIVVSGLSNVS